jgi:uncharacterized membrane protein SpoIIM required for sporulation
MLELLIFPKEGQKKPWRLFLVGLLYASLAYLLVHFIFASDVVLSRYSGLLVPVFTALFSIIFVHYSMRLDEEENLADKDEDDIKSIMQDWKILSMFLYLFLGFIVAFSFWQIIFSAGTTMNAQIETYCVIKNPIHYENCLNQYNAKGMIEGIDVTPQGSFSGIFMNNIIVLLIIFIFSLLFGAGSIFIIAWNASIIAIAIGLSIKYNLLNLLLGILKFMVHGLPEIAAYFIVAMAGGMASFALIGFIRKTVSKDNLFKIMRRIAILICLGIIVLAIGAGIEIFITPMLF